MIFDEATAFMDSQTEKIFKQATMEIFANRTIITIAHRLSSIMMADKILVFDNGQIIQEGTHDDLVKINGLYKKLYNEQYNKNNLNLSST